jgi:methyl-accepting chemotaxis protein
MNIGAMKVGTRLSIGFGLVLALMMVMAGTELFALGEIGSLSKEIVDRDLVKAEAATTINSLTTDNGVKTLMLFVITDKNEMARIDAQIAANKKAITAALDTLDKLVVRPEGKATLAKIREARKQYVTSFEAVRKLLDEGKRDEASAMMGNTTLPLLNTLQNDTRALAGLQKKFVDDDSIAIENSISVTQLRTSVFVPLALSIGIAAAVLIARSLLKQLGGEPEYAARVANEIAAGNLGVAVDTKPGDESSLIHAIKTMRDSLAGIVGEVRAGTEVVSIASRQIAAGNIDLSSRTEEQASSLQETASSIEELTATVKGNADHARQANELTHSASEAAKRGSAVVSEVVEVMHVINESSRRIVDIIGVIDSIAFQTNILALNAAVEAARAGEQGRGFAVVAAEVRNLAQRSASAAKEIKDLINDSVETVAEGTKLVGRAGESMRELLSSVDLVTGIVGEISDASREQTGGIEQINIAVNQMDQATQQNAALVEQAAAAAESLQERAEELARAVRVFRLEGNLPALGNSPAPRLLLNQGGVLAVA